MKTQLIIKNIVAKAHKSALKLSLFLFLLLEVVPAGASEIYEYYRGARMLGMGGAYTAVVNDETALLTNPAGLGKIRDFTITVLDPEVEGSFNDTNILNSGNYKNALGIQGLLDILKQNKDTHLHVKGQIFPSLVVPNFGFGIHVKTQVDAEVDKTGTDYTLDYTSDYAAALGYALRLGGGVVKIGVTGRAVDRTEAHKVLPANSTGLKLEPIGSEGVGIAADVGLILTLPVELLPTLAATIRDAGGTAYTLSNGMFYSTTTRPVETKQTIDAGIAFFPIIGNGARISFTAEGHDLNTLSEEKDKMKRLHAGMEINIADFMFIRGGLNQRYWTAGLEFSTERFQFQAASYGEELGTETTPKEDRRWVAKLGFRF